MTVERTIRYSHEDIAAFARLSFDDNPLHIDPAIAALAGFALGLIADSLTPGAFGAGALAMTIVGFGASWLKAAFFADNLALNGMFVFLGKWAFDLIFLVSERRLRGSELFVQAVLWSPLSATATALTGLVVLLAVRPVLGAPRT